MEKQNEPNSAAATATTAATSTPNNLFIFYKFLITYTYN